MDGAQTWAWPGGETVVMTNDPNGAVMTGERALTKLSQPDQAENDQARRPGMVTR